MCDDAGIVTAVKHVMSKGQVLVRRYRKVPLGVLGNLN